MDDNDPRIPALQLLLGDADDNELWMILIKAFGGRIHIETPNTMLNYAENRSLAASYVAQARAKVGSPPLGKLACDGLALDLDEVLAQLSLLKTLTNPKR